MSQTHGNTRPNSLYESDFYTWTQEQARLLRERRFDDLDLENLIDEVASVGSSEKREIRSRLKILLTHLLKWKFQPGLRGNSWSSTIFEQRGTVMDIIESSPSLRGYVDYAMRLAYVGARVEASQQTGLMIGLFPAECPFSVAETLDLNFFPEDPPNE
jgi:Domain of unknown function DUF29